MDKQLSFGSQEHQPYVTVEQTARWIGINSDTSTIGKVLQRLCPARDGTSECICGTHFTSPLMNEAVKAMARAVDEHILGIFKKSYPWGQTGFQLVDRTNPKEDPS